MNILFICEVDYMRRVVYELHQIPELLAQRGHNIYVIDYEDGWSKNSNRDTFEANVERAYPFSGVKVKLIQPGFIKVPIISRISAFKSHYHVIKETIQKYNIDIIVLYSVPTNGLQTVKLANQFGIPVVFRSIDILHKLVPKLLSFPTKIMESIVYRHVDRIFTITPALSGYVSGLGCDMDKIELLPLGVDIDNCEIDDGYKARYGIEPDDKVIVFAGTLPEFCGIDQFIPVFAKVLNMVPEAKLLIIGDGPLMPKLKNIVTKLCIEKRVVVTGMKPHHIVSELINIADIGVQIFPLTKTTNEIFPTKVIQYMAQGKPVVSTPLEGLKRFGLNVQQGVIYASMKIDMADVIVNLLVDNDKRVELGKRALKYVMDTHEYSQVIDKWEYKLKELVR